MKKKVIIGKFHVPVMALIAALIVSAIILVVILSAILQDGSKEIKSITQTGFDFSGKWYDTGEVDYYIFDSEGGLKICYMDGREEEGKYRIVGEIIECDLESTDIFFLVRGGSLYHNGMEHSLTRKRSYEQVQAPTDAPTDAPTEEPTDAPTEEPTDAPTEEPTDAPTEEPTEEPTEAPTEEPTTQAPTEANPHDLILGNTYCRPSDAGDLIFTFQSREQVEILGGGFFYNVVRYTVNDGVIVFDMAKGVFDEPIIITLTIMDEATLKRDDGTYFYQTN